MIDFLVLQVKMGKITVDDVPSKWRDKVIERLNRS